MRRFTSIFALIPALFACLFLSSETSWAATRTTTTAAARPVRTDSQIDATIRTKLAKSKIGKDGFKYHVQRGVVTWEGTTNVMQHKGSATRMARSAGAAQVVNNIQVSAAARAKSTANLKKAQVSE